jgi:hypothetical protein
MCYIPFVAFVLYFIEKEKTGYGRHIRYWMVLWWTFLVLVIILRWLFTWLVILAYILISLFLGYRAYNKEDVDIKFVDDLFTNKEKKSQEKEEGKEEETEDNKLKE